MPQHFLLSKAARTLSLVDLMQMTDAQVLKKFMELRFAKHGGTPHCPECGSLQLYECPRKTGLMRWRCKHCPKEFTVTSNTLFAWRRMPLRMYLAAIVIFVNEVKGKSALALSRDLKVQYKTAFVLAHKLREAMAAEDDPVKLGGPGTEVEIDGAYFGGYVRPANEKKDRKDRRKAENQNPNKRVLVVIRERGGPSTTKVFESEADSVVWIKQTVKPNTVVYADESSGWDSLQGAFKMKRISHKDAYSKGGANTNLAESFFSRIRRSEIGHHHRIIGPYLFRYAQEMNFREDRRREANGSHLERLMTAALARKPSRSFCGYWQRHLATD